MDAITFSPLYMERVWGGRVLEHVYNRQLPCPDSPFGESWEMTDRAEEQSVVRDGEFAGKTLSDLWQNHREQVFGGGFEGDERFPLLIKILDARDDLSIQVHPPAEIAEELCGEPKTEMWYIAAADEGAKLYVGLKNGVSEQDFRQSIETGTVDEMVHAITPKVGDSIFIPSGRLHAIGAGLLIYEIQQNSDTTYRVFDWNRMGLDGNPRQLHVEQSMRCIDFSDSEPAMDTPDGSTIATCPYFHVEKHNLATGAMFANLDHDRFSIVTIVSGKLETSSGTQFVAGDFLLLPRGANALKVSEDAIVLQTTIPR